MKEQSLMEMALKTKWNELSQPLKMHYQLNSNTDVGALDIHYPWFMQPVLNVLRVMGALVNRKGRNITTTVEKTMQDGIQYWCRNIKYSDGKTILFKSHWVYTQENKLIEYINPYLGLQMSVTVKDGDLYYSGECFVLKIGTKLMSIPEWLLLGHTSIKETEINENSFAMDFRLKHPLFGEIFSYAGVFKTRSLEQ